ncbi:MAG: transposase [Rhodospirillales bacterium]|nr:transposase [Rhodospirillales bacterium]
MNLAAWPVLGQLVQFQHEKPKAPYAEQPGANVRQKAGLNRSILQTGWGDLRGMLAYKAVTVVAVNPAYTSQTCHACGHVSAASRPCQARFECVSCGHTAQADVNAARNILALGTGQLDGKERWRWPLR